MCVCVCVLVMFCQRSIRNENDLVTEKESTFKGENCNYEKRLNSLQCKYTTKERHHNSVSYIYFSSFSPFSIPYCMNIYPERRNGDKNGIYCKSLDIN